MQKEKNQETMGANLKTKFFTLNGTISSFVSNLMKSASG